MAEQMDGNVKVDYAAIHLLSQHLGDGGSEGGLAVIDVADGANVEMGLGAFIRAKATARCRQGQVQAGLAAEERTAQHRYSAQ